jgi:hypothetical protein
MDSRRKKELDGKPLSLIADVMAEAGPDSSVDQMCRSEFLFRQTAFLQRSAEASERAANAAAETAIYTQKYTRYMLWSVIILLLSVIIAFSALVAKEDPRMVHEPGEPRPAGGVGK